MVHPPKRPVDWVDPQIDTGNPKVRWVFSSSACRPFGLVRLSPDTDPVGTWGSGYRYFSNKIHCFSHIHAWQLSGIPVMPIKGTCSGPVRIQEIGSTFSHEKETVRAGYHSVFLETYGIDAELTATERVGFHRYRFPDTETCSVVFDLGAELGPSRMSDVMLRVVGPDELEGYVENAPTGRRPKPCRVFFVIRFDTPFESFGAWDDREFKEKAEMISGEGSGGFVQFSAAGGIVVRMKVGVSYVSTTQARLNLDTELSHWDFDRACRETEDRWNEWLERIEIEGGSESQRTKFYTDIWRSLQGGYLTSDVDGSYCDNTGEESIVRKIPIGSDGRPTYRCLEGDIFWGAHWSLSLLWGLAYPEIVSDWCNTLVGYQKNGGLIPRGPSGGNHTYVMIGSHSTAFIVAAYMKGIRTFDIDSAYQGMRKNALPGGLMSKAGYEHHSCLGGGIEYYIERGYIPERPAIPGLMHIDGAAQTLEYAYDDWCLAQMAKALGEEADFRQFIERSENFRNLYNPSSGFMQPRDLDGAWLEPFDPLSLEGWCESNGWQYTFYVPHDIQGLIGLMGGREAFTGKLNHAFEKAVSMDFYARKPELRRDAAYINYGNEPGRFVAFLFNHSGSPWLSQKWARQVQERTFSSVGPVGFCEDDDNGLAAATSALLAIGLFDVRGGAAREPVYEIASPIFDKVVISLDKRYYKGGTFTIETRNNSRENKYIQSATLNDQPLARPWFRHDQLTAGGVLTIHLGSQPNRKWGTLPTDAPPSMSTDEPR
jgi:predicted alpha-1,2-mannosidase